MFVETKREPRVDRQPFIFPIGRKIGGGIHSEVSTLGEDFVVKRILPIWQWRQGWERKLVGDFRLLERFFQPYIPSTGFIRCEDQDGSKNFLIVQRRVKARPLKDWKWNELKDNKHAIDELDDFADRVAGMHQSTGKTPDLHGGRLINPIRQYDFKSTDNILIEPSGKVWLIDVDRLGPLWSERWPLGKIHMGRIARAVRDFRQKLKAREFNRGE